MSTKTTFKRIALVAVAALGLGVLSVAPSSAAVGAITFTNVSNGTAALDSSANVGGETATGAQFTVNTLVTGTDSITVQFIATGTNPTGSSVRPLLTFLDSTSAQTGTLATNGTVRGYSAGESVTVGGVITESTTANNQLSAKFALTLESQTSSTRKAGTYNYLVIVKAYDAGVINEARTVTQALSITIAPSAAASETPSSATSAVYLANAATVSPNADSASVTGVATAGTLVGNLNVRVRNALDGQTAVDTVTITVTGPGLIDTTSDTKYLRVVGQTGDVNYPIIADGLAGVSTIKVDYEVTKQSFTKTLTFYAANATTITPTVRTPVLKVGSNTGAVGVSAVDVNGNAWLGTAYIVASSAADAAIAGSTTPVACAAWTPTNGIRCDITGVSAGTAKFKVIDKSTVAAATATSAEFTVTVSSAPAASVKVEFDKSTYGPYEKATIIVSVMDAAGNLVPANTFANLFAAGGITANQSFTGTSDTLTAVSVTTEVANSSTTGAIALKKIYTVYMPAQGDVTLSWTGGTSLLVSGQKAGSATASVVNSSVDAATDAANEATDAANAATDAALAAADAADAATAAAQDASDAVAALSASVSKMISNLRAQITSLTNLVIKIQKKVRA